MEKNTQDKVILKEPLPVIQVPEKKIIAVEDNQTANKASGETEKQENTNQMDIEMKSTEDDIVTPDNQS
jgi:hypothetical protein